MTVKMDRTYQADGRRLNEIVAHHELVTPAYLIEMEENQSVDNFVEGLFFGNRFGRRLKRYIDDGRDARKVLTKISSLLDEYAEECCTV